MVNKFKLIIFKAIDFKICTLYYVLLRVLQLFFQFEIVIFRIELGFWLVYVSFTVETYKEGVGKIQTFTKTSNLREKNVWTIDNSICVDNRCIGINTETSPNNPDDTNDARKVHKNLWPVCFHFAFINV